MFNRDPGPGSYTVVSAQADSVISGTATSVPTHFNIQGVGNGFVSKADRFATNGLEIDHDPKINVAPGQYDPKEIESHPQAPKFDSKSGFTLPFNENNPLNFVKPITVNIYFK